MLAQRPVMTASCSSSTSKRSPVSGNGMPYAACSASYQPAPRPSSTRPPLIWSTPATEIASGPGCRKVALVISVPSRIVLVSRARPGQRDPGVARPGQPVAAHRQVVVGAEERPEAEPLGLLRDPEEVVVRRALLGFGEDTELHGSQPASRSQRTTSKPSWGSRPVSVQTARSISGKKVSPSGSRSTSLMQLRVGVRQRQRRRSRRHRRRTRPPRPASSASSRECVDQHAVGAPVGVAGQHDRGAAGQRTADRLVGRPAHQQRVAQRGRP